MTIQLAAKLTYVEMDSINTADFKNTSLVHDWKNHVPCDLINIWADLSLNTKVAVYMTAEKAANTEEWE